MELKKYKLKEVTSELHSGDTISAKDIYTEGDYPVFGGNGQRGYTNNWNQDGSYVIIGRQGAYCGNTRYHIGKSYLSEHAIVAKPINGVNPIYLSELLSLIDLSRFQGQSAQPGLSVETLSNIQIKLPNSECQNNIGELLLTIDRKIALNREINRNLEAMARQLYDYWFVQFDFPD
ncbi:MAG: restriction endonuclease subunit S, partial [Muribaculaceae bacterium]|nr:restriction endonuclease subunit S [Muribaculaceae bacterium]